MPFFYPIDKEFIELAKELVTEFVPKPNAKWIRYCDPEFDDPEKPWIKNKPNEIIHDVRIITDRDDLEDRQLKKFKVLRDFFGHVQTTEIVDGQLNAWLYPQGFEPSLSDKVVFAGNKYAVKAIDPIQPVKQAIIYFVELGR